MSIYNVPSLSSSSTDASTLANDFSALSLNDLPKDALTHIFGFLKPKMLSKARCVVVRWRDLIDENRVFTMKILLEPTRRFIAQIEPWESTYLNSSLVDLTGIQATINPSDAKKTAATIKQPTRRDEAYGRIVKVEVKTDPKDAKETAAFIKNPEMRIKALLEISKSGDTTTLAEAKKIAATIAHPAVQSIALQEIIDIETTIDLAEAKNTAATIPEPYHRERSLRKISMIEQRISPAEIEAIMNPPLPPLLSSSYNHFDPRNWAYFQEYKPVSEVNSIDTKPDVKPQSDITSGWRQATMQDEPSISARLLLNILLRMAQK